MLKFDVQDLSIRYSDDNESLRHIHLGIEANEITVLFGPAGGGKSTLLRVLNRPQCSGRCQRYVWPVLFNGSNFLDPKTDVIELRRKIAWLFTAGSPPPRSTRNVALGLAQAGEHRKSRSWMMR